MECIESDNADLVGNHGRLLHFKVGRREKKFQKKWQVVLQDYDVGGK